MDEPLPELWQVSWPLVYPSNTHAERAQVLRRRLEQLGGTVEAIRRQIERDPWNRTVDCGLER